MTLDDGPEIMSPRAAAAIERGDDPVLPETAVAQRVGALLGKHLDPAWLTPRALTAIGNKVVANRAALRVLFDEVDADPRRLGDRKSVLRQDRPGSLSHEDVLLERLHHIDREREELLGWLRSMRSVHVEYDPDERAAQEDTDRLNAERRAEKAADQAPRGIAS